jgi:hypothetical protein
MRVVTVLALLCLAVAVIRQPVTRWATRRSLDKMQGYRGDFLDARISFLPLSYTITRLKLVPDDTSLPTFYVERLQSGLFARDLIRGRLRAWANVERAKMTFFLIPIVIPDIAAIVNSEGARPRVPPFSRQATGVMCSHASAPDSGSPGRARAIGALRRRRGMSQTPAHFAHEGSLTTPPCTEGVQWIVLLTQPSVSRSQLDRFRVRYAANARPTQAWRGRKIELAR